MALDLFISNSFNQYDSLDEFISGFEIINSTEGETVFDGFLRDTKNNKSYYQRTNNKRYTLQNVPYSLLVDSAIKYTLSSNSKDPSSIPFFGAGLILQYLMFTTIPVNQIIEENTFIKSNKREFLFELHVTFRELRESFKDELNIFFSKKDCKERLLYILLYSEISLTKAEALAENSLFQKDLNNIITYYEEISK